MVNRTRKDRECLKVRRGLPGHVFHPHSPQAFKWFSSKLDDEKQQFESVDYLRKIKGSNRQR